MNFEQARTQMIKQQIRAWDVLDQNILDLIAQTPREEFVPPEYRYLAFADTNIPIGNGQVMLTPKEEARILQALKIRPHETVLEIGTGSGYFTALLAKQAKNVVSIDIFPEFIEQATQKLKSHNLHNIEFHQRDAAQGYNNGTTFDVIVISGSLINLPIAFSNALSTKGRLFAIVGQAPAMEALLLTRKNKEQWHFEMLFETVVPPLIHAKQPNQFIF